MTFLRSPQSTKMTSSIRSGRRRVAQGKASDGGRVAIFGERRPGSSYTPDSYSSIRRGETSLRHFMSPRLIEELSSIWESFSQGMADGGAHRHLAFGSCFSPAVPWAILLWPFRPF
jgi:hypothetical protein